MSERAAGFAAAGFAALCAAVGIALLAFACSALADGDWLGAVLPAGVVLVLFIVAGAAWRWRKG